MKIRYDKEVDALYLRLNNSKIVESDAVKPGIVLDFNAENEVVGIEACASSGVCRRRISGN